MKKLIKTTFFNGISKNILLNIDIAYVRLTKSSDLFILKSSQLFGEVNSLLKKNLSSIVSDIDNYNFDINVISPDYFSLKMLHSHFDIKELSDFIAIASLFYLLLEEGFIKPRLLEDFDKNKSFNNYFNYYKKKLNDILVSKINQTKLKNNKDFAKIDSCFSKRKYIEARKIFDTINFSSLLSFEKAVYKRHELKLNYYENKSKDKENKKLFIETLKKYDYNKDILPYLYFDYIKYAEDNRNRDATEFIKKFENEFIITDVSEDIKAYYFYLKGRNSYYNGFYIEALDLLEKSYNIYHQLKNEDMLASVYNSTANCFSDNLFFEEALFIAEKALKIRMKLKSPLLGETYGLLGNIYFKKTEFDKSVEYYKKSLEFIKEIDKKNYSKTLNYLAKSCIFNKDYSNAANYIAQSKNLLVNENEKNKSFTYLYELLLAYYKNDAESFNSIFRIFANPVNYNNFDKFPLAWAFTYKALFDYNEKDVLSGNKNILNAMNIFNDDRYFFEAGFIWNYYVLNNPNDSSLQVSDRNNNIMIQLIKHLEEYYDLPKKYFKDLFLELNIDIKPRLKDYHSKITKFNKSKNVRSLIKRILKKIDFSLL